jgi:hypothetical protein
MAVRGRAFLSEQIDDIRIRYDKSGLAKGVTRDAIREQRRTADYAPLIRPTGYGLSPGQGYDRDGEID